MSRIKDLEEEKNRFSRSNAAQQIQIDKYKKLAEDAKGKADSLENQLSSLRKVKHIYLTQPCLFCVCWSRVVCIFKFYSFIIKKTK